ncbi:MAG: radical SAM family heme chaperone HemW [Clostridia bacterium]|nr:radical SAM family heme chaperone HemW [Clostridia bacterium]
MRPLGIYIHVPFCLRKCAYCDFYSGPSGEAEREAYVSALVTHIKDERQKWLGHTVDTVFFGGGTPSLLTPNQFHRILSAVAENGALSSEAEISLEANPATVTLEGLKELRRAGANRISIGLQSACDEELKLLGRIHTVADFDLTLAHCREAGFDNVNVDLMYGIPAQTEESFAHTLDFVTERAPEHISAYSLILEPGTPLARRAETLQIPDEDETADRYDLLCRTLSARGYEHYEISNFAKAGYRCRHNVKYWQREEYLGFGPSAHSFFDGCRFYYPPDRKSYCSPATRQILFEETDTGLTDAEEALMLAMRLSDGVDTARFFAEYGVDFEAKYGERILPYIKGGLIRKTERGYAFTDRGMFVSNYILAEIL